MLRVIDVGDEGESLESKNMCLRTHQNDNI